jgi:hypothetical protein
MAGGRWSSMVGSVAAAIGICFAAEGASAPENPFLKAMETPPPPKTPEQVERDSRIAWNAAFKAMRVKRKNPKG